MTRGCKRVRSREPYEEHQKEMSAEHLQKELGTLQLAKTQGMVDDVERGALHLACFHGWHYWEKPVLH